MAKSRRAPSLVVRTPRHASRRIRPALAAEIRKIAKEPDVAKVDFDGKLAVNDPTHPLGMASDSASEWNSMLITARADRGPQWDVATQRFMVDFGSHLYFDPSPLTITEEPTPPPDEVSAAGPSSGADSSSSMAAAMAWQADPRFSQYNIGGGSSSGNLSNVSTPSRSSLRLQHQQHQQHQQHHHQHQQQHQQHQQHQHPHPLNGHGNGIPMGSPYPYGLTNGRIPEQHHYIQTQAPVQVPHSYYDSSQSQMQTHAPIHGHNPSHVHHIMSNGIGLGGVGSPMLGRQMSMSSGMGLGMEFGGGVMGGPPDVPSPDMRRRTRSQHDGQLEIGW